MREDDLIREYTKLREEYNILQRIRIEDNKYSQILEYHLPKNTVDDIVNKIDEKGINQVLKESKQYYESNNKIIKDGGLNP